MSDDDVTSVAGCYQDGLDLARRGAYFEAHEGLVHVVVSAYQRGRDRPVAAESQRLKALRRLAAFEPVHRGLDVRRLREALERAEADPREYLVERDLQPPVTPEEQE